MTDALARLDASGVEIEVIALAKACLSAEVERRPRNAGALADRVTSYLSGVQERLRSAELARVEAQAHAEAESKQRCFRTSWRGAHARAGEAMARARIERSRRRRTVALAASVLMIASLVGGGWAYLLRQRLERASLFNQALGEFELLRNEAERVGDDLARWRTAREAARAVERLLAQAPDEPSRSRAITLVREVTQATAAAANDQKLLAGLVDVRSSRAEDPDGSRTDAAYADAFHEGGIDIGALPADQLGAKIRARPEAVRIAQAAALDDWAAVRRSARGDEAGARWILNVARSADPDPWRNRLRVVLETSSSPESLRRLRDLAKSARMEELPTVSVDLLGRSLLALGDPMAAVTVLRQGQSLYPDDVWLNYYLALCLRRLSRREEAIRYYMAARSVRPDMAHALADALVAMGETDQAIGILQKLRRTRPTDVKFLIRLARLLHDRGRADEANDVLAEAVARLSVAVRLKKDFYPVHLDLGTALTMQGKLDEANAEFRIALRLEPKDARTHVALGSNLAERHKLDAANAEFRTALRLAPDYVDAHVQLSQYLRQEGKLGQAIAESREALRLEPDNQLARSNLGGALAEQGKFDEAIAELREALRLKPDSHDGHENFGVTLFLQGRRDEAIAEYHVALNLKSDCPIAHCNLGDAFMEQGKQGEAIAEYRAALSLKPDFAKAHLNLGSILVDQGKLDEAIAEFREALRFNPDYAFAHNGLAVALLKQGKLEEAIAELRTAIRLKPDRLAAHGNLGLALRDLGKLEEAIAEFRTAIRLKPDDVESHLNLAKVLDDQGKPNAAIAEYRVALRQNPDSAKAHTNLGNALAAQEKLDEATAEHRTALRLEPDYAEAHCNLGGALRQQGHFVEALVEFKRGHELASKKPNWRFPSAEWVRETERLVKLDRELPAILAGKAKPSDAGETLGFAQVCYQKRLHGASARLWSEAFDAQPKLADDMQVQNRYNAACAAALAGASQGKDDLPLDEAAKARWRKQSIGWLMSDLKAWSKLSESAPPQARQSIVQTLHHWKVDPDLAALRDPAALAKLPDEEQKACRALWSDVDALLAKITSKSSP